MKIKLLLFLSITLCLSSYSQEISENENEADSSIITGIVVDKNDGEPLPYAYLKLEKTSLGTATDGDGRFRISIPSQYDTYNITVSYIGFKDLTITVASLKDEKHNLISMIPDVYSLNTIVIGEPKKLPKAKSLLKKVIKKIPENYSNAPSIITGYYRETMKENGNYIQYTDAVCNYYEIPYRNKKMRWKDYQSSYDFSILGGSFSFDTSSLHRLHFHHRTLKEEQAHIVNSRSSSNLSKKNFKSNIAGGPLGLFARNRVKYQQSFLGKKAKRDFTYEISEETDENGNDLYVLDFHTKTTKEKLDALESPTNRKQWRLANKRKLLKGRIYINQKDLAIVRYECSVPNELKEYFCGYKSNMIKHFDYKLDVRFKKKGKRYYVDNMRHEDEFIFKDSISNETTFYSAISEFKTTSIAAENVKKFPKEENFANTTSNQLFEFPLGYDTEFWETYTSENSIATIDSEIRRNMEMEKSLEKQFKDKHIRNDTMAAPIATAKPSSFKIHRETYTDDYAWLKDVKAPKNNKPVMEYLEAENAYAANYNIPLRKTQRAIYKQLIQSVEKNSTSLPIKENGYFYYSKYSEDDEYPVYYRKPLGVNTKEEVLLNVNEMAKEKDYYAASIGSPSPNNKLIAIYENTTGKDESILKFKDLETQTFLTDSISNIGSMVWLTNTTFLYSKVEKQTYRSSTVLKHVLGTDSQNDKVIYQEKDPSFNVAIGRTKSKEYIFLTTGSSTSSETWYLKLKEPNATFKLIQPREKKHLYAVTHHKDQFYILTDKDALNYKVMTAQISENSLGEWKELIPHQPGVLIQNFELFDNYMVINEKENAQSRIKIIELDTEKSHYIRFKEDFYNIGIGYNPDIATDSLQFSYSSFDTPATTFKYHMKTRKKRLVKQHGKKIGNPYRKYKVQRKWVTASDGKQIPLTLISNKWLAKPKGYNFKVYLTSYGSYGSGQGIPNSATVQHLVNSGYVFAIAHVRGGDDMGMEWYEDGKMFNKKNTFSDFIACADYLIEEGYAIKGSIVASGGSAGGLLMGAVVNERPELFHTVILDVPFVDVINTMLDENLPLTVGEFEEWGNPKNKKEYQYIKSYSPYDNVKAQEYPNMLFFTGLNDTRVGYWEPAKMVAKLRATKTDDNLLLLKTSFNNGHGGGSGRYAGFRESAYKLALIYDLYDPEEFRNKK